MQLKPYQSETLATLRDFLEAARLAGPAAAYDNITSAPDQAKRLGRYRDSYRPLDGLPGMPYVCLRLPTGGGKTLLAAHAIGVARDAWLERDYPLVLWLVPSNTIRQQTVDALRNPRHPYRAALDTLFEGRVRVFDIADFTNIRPHDIADNCCIVVGTIQTLRVNNTEGRKVYAHNENMEPHFSAIQPNTPGLEQLDGSTDTVGKPRFSFANLLHVQRPLMIVDEAHNAVTGLSRDMQIRVNPSAIIEFTATPRLNSNILHSVTAQELKAAEMIKLPIILAEHETWQNAVNGAIASRAALADAAKGEAEYLRPIVLFQAQPRNQEVTVDVLKAHLMETEQIPENRIAIATGDQRDLDGLDLFDPACKIEYIITIEALKEGWDCSFAYVFCSVSRIQSATEVEQLLGRVLRMPYAKRRADESLNRAYAHVSEASFGQAAVALVDKLVAMGFDEQAAKDSIVPAQGHMDESGLFGPRDRPAPVFRHTVTVAPHEAEAIGVATSGTTVAVIAKPDGALEIAVIGRVAPEIEATLAAALPEAAKPAFVAAVKAYRLETKDILSPAEQGIPFVAPRLLAEIQGHLEFADADTFAEFHDWSLASYPARLDEAAFAIRDTAHGFEIDLDGNKIIYQIADDGPQLSLDMAVSGWTKENLELWLDRQLRQPDIHQSDMMKWLSDCVGHLLAVRKIPIAALMRGKFVLMRKLRDRINAARIAEQSKSYQRYLLDPGAHPAISFDHGFVFKDGMYRDVARQRDGHWKPRKHFLGAGGLPAFDGVAMGEEFQCAQAVDSLPEVKFWLRNVARHPQSYWLPLASGKFYPDFVAELNDGRFMVVEYKGALLAGPGNDDTNEKRTIGQLLESSSGGKALFIMVEKNVSGRDMRGQLQDKLAS